MSLLDKKYVLTINLEDSTITYPLNMSFFNTDKNIANLYVKVQYRDEVIKYISKTDAVNYNIKLTVIKPKSNNLKEVQGVITNDFEEDYAIYKFELPSEFTDQVGSVVCEFLITNANEILTTSSFSYTIKASKVTGLNPEIIPNPDLPVLKQLIDDVKSAQQWISNIDDTKISEVKTYSNKKIEDIKAKVDEQFISIKTQYSNKEFVSTLKKFPKFVNEREMDACDGSFELNAETIKSSDIYMLYDNLIAKYPNNITRFFLGKDQSGTKDVYKYVFDFSNSEKCIILGANLHGNGVDGDPQTGAITLYNIMKSICDDWTENECLAVLKYSFKFVVMPVQNPWGFDNNNRRNSRNVDLNRNFDFKWNENTDPTKGSSAFSEVESRYIRDVLNQYKDTAIAYYDYHTMANRTTPFRYISVHSETSECVDVANEVSDYVSKKNSFTKQVDNNSFISTSSGFNYATNVVGIPSCNPEFVVYPTNSELPHHGAKLMTLQYEFFIQFIYRHCVLRSNYKTEELIANTRGVLLQYNGVNTPLAENTTLRLNAWNVAYDTESAYQSQYSRIVVPKNTSYIKITASAGFYYTIATDTNVRLQVHVLKGGSIANSSTIARSVQLMNSSANNSSVLIAQSPLLKVVEGDQLHFEVLQKGGGAGVKLDNTLNPATYWFVEFIK